MGTGVVPLELAQEFKITEFVNDLPKEVPNSIRERWWGLVNRRWSLTFLFANEASAMRHYVDKLAIDTKRSVPAYLITDEFIIELQNVQMYVYGLIFSSTLRPANGINERLSIIRQVSENVTTPRTDEQKRGFRLW